MSTALVQAQQQELAGEPAASAEWIEAAPPVSSMRHREALGAVTEYLAARIRGVSGFFILALILPWAALLLAVATVIHGRFFTTMLDDMLSSMGEEVDPTMRANYARGLLFNRSLWAEFRVFDAHRWLLGYLVHHSALGRASSARQRSRHTRAVMADGAVIMVLYFAVLWALTNSVLHHNHNTRIAVLVLAFQGSLLLPDLCPNGDVAVSYRQAVQVEAEIAQLRAVDEVASPRLHTMWWNGHRVQAVHGPQDPSERQVAETLTAEIGLPVNAEQISDISMFQRHLPTGISPR